MIKNRSIQITITPTTKLHDLLTTFPDLEPILMEMSPDFRKLKNPILRKTIARVATLKQVAKIGNLSLIELISQLRKKAGIHLQFKNDAESLIKNQEKPSWYEERKISNSLDIKPHLDRGEQPIGEVLNLLNNLHKGKILEVMAPFRLDPIIDIAKKKGLNI